MLQVKSSKNKRSYIKHIGASTLPAQGQHWHLNSKRFKAATVDILGRKYKGPKINSNIQ